MVAVELQIATLAPPTGCPAPLITTSSFRAPCARACGAHAVNSSATKAAAAVAAKTLGAAQNR